VKPSLAFPSEALTCKSLTWQYLSIKNQLTGSYVLYPEGYTCKNLLTLINMNHYRSHNRLNEEIEDPLTSTIEYREAYPEVFLPVFKKGTLHLELFRPSKIVL